MVAGVCFGWSNDFFGLSSLACQELEEAFLRLNSMNIQEILHILACPKCHGDLTLEGEPDAPVGLCCQECQVVYPIQDDIPIMLIDEAIPKESFDKTQG